MLITSAGSLRSKTLAVAVVVAAMCAHPYLGGVQGNGCAALANVCAGYDAASCGRRARAAAAGALEAAAAAGDAAGMGPTALRALCGDDEELRRRAIAAGAAPVVFEEP